MSKPQVPNHRRRTHWTIWGWLVVLAVITRPYRGIFHDGILYAAQALQRLDPRALDKDMFFAYGNQDSFSVFTSLYAPAIDEIGLFQATYVFWALGLLIWTAAVIILARTVMPTGRDALISVACVLCLYPGYGNMQLSYGEAWVTPRLWAEALCMIAIAAALRRHIITVGIASLLALLLHPLIGFSGVTLAFWLLCRRKRAFFVTAGVALGGSLVAGVIGLGPFGWLFQQIDAAWWDVIEQYVQIVQVRAWWSLALLVWLPLPIVSFWLVWCHGPRRHRDLISGIILIGAGFTLLSFLLTDVLHNRYFTALQLWRAEIWIALFGNLFAWSAYCCLPHGAPSRHIFGVALVLTALPSLLGVPPISGGFVALAAVLIHASERSRRGRLKILYVGASVILLLASVLSLPAMVMAIFDHSGVADVFWQAIALLIATVGVWAILKGDSRLTGIGLVVCLPLAIISADKRSDQQAFLAAKNAVPQTFSDRLHGKTFYWEGELAIAWFGLKMPNYYSCQHLSGVVFHRLQALEVVRRAAVLSVLRSPNSSGNDSANCPDAASAKDKEEHPISPLVQVCNSVPDLDYIILDQMLSPPPVASWTAPFSSRGPQYVPVQFRTKTLQETTTYYLYPCDRSP